MDDVDLIDKISLNLNVFMIWLIIDKGEIINIYIYIKILKMIRYIGYKSITIFNLSDLYILIYILFN